MRRWRSVPRSRRSHRSSSHRRRSKSAAPRSGRQRNTPPASAAARRLEFRARVAPRRARGSAARLAGRVTLFGDCSGSDAPVGSDDVGAPTDHAHLAARPGRTDPRFTRRGQSGSRRAVVPDDARRLLLACGRVRAARACPIGNVDLEHRRDRRAQGRLRRGPVERRADRHPVHDGARHAAEGARVVRLCRRERTGPYPVPPNAPIEGGSRRSGDRHVLVVDRDACRLWELYSAYLQNGGASWTAGSGATWRPTSNAMRPLGWTSGDAAGLPILSWPRPLRRGRGGRDRPRHPLHCPEDGGVPTSGRRATRPRPAAPRIRRWAPGSG